jgi:hypothetical protein
MNDISDMNDLKIKKGEVAATCVADSSLQLFGSEPRYPSMEFCAKRKTPEVNPLKADLRPSQ